MKKKIEEKARQEDQQIFDSQTAGITSSNSNRLVLELAKKEGKPATGTGLSSPILQVGGEIEEELAKYSFEGS